MHTRIRLHISETCMTVAPVSIPRSISWEKCLHLIGGFIICCTFTVIITKYIMEYFHLENLDEVEWICCTSQTSWSDHNIFDLTSSHFDSYCMSLTYHHGWSPPVLPLRHHTHAPACHHLPLVSPKHSDDREKELEALNSTNTFLRNHTTFMMKW